MSARPQNTPSQGTEVAQDCSSRPSQGPVKEAVMRAFLEAKTPLGRVESRIEQSLNSEAELLSQISHYLLKQGGKRIRPLLAIMSQRLFNHPSPSNELVDVAAGIELIHMATLLHDDIIDQSPTRRHQVSAYHRFGLAPSLLSGDFLLVRAFGLCAHLDNYVVEATERACVELTEGEVLEGTLESSTPRSLEDYINIVGKKTAALFALACDLGAYLGGAAPANIALMREFGFHAGIAFQMIDDILDITADENLLGKPAGTDLRQKVPSLVNILWLASGDEKALEFFSRKTISAEESRQAADYLKNSEIITSSRKLASTYAAKANQNLSMIQASSTEAATRSQLLAIVEYTLDRCL